MPAFFVLAMIPAGWQIGGVTIPILDIESPPYANALQYTAPIVGIWMLIGIVLYFVLRARDPRRPTEWMMCTAGGTISN